MMATCIKTVVGGKQGHTFSKILKDAPTKHLFVSVKFIEVIRLTKMR